MSQKFPALTEKLTDLIKSQQVFFCATAAHDGRVNMSPKGTDSLRILGPNRVIWLNLTGSGNETAAHILDNPRMTLMFCNFSGAATTLRLYGTASFSQSHDEGWEEALSHFPDLPGARQIFDLTIDLVQTSCGTGVPQMTVTGDRVQTEFVDFWRKAGPSWTSKYHQKKNRVSLDGLPTGIPE